MELLPLAGLRFLHLSDFRLVLACLHLAAVAQSARNVPGRFKVRNGNHVRACATIFLGALGPGGERHLPLIFALFLYILFCNLLELIPFFRAATANPSTTIGLGIIVFFYTQYVGITSKGLERISQALCRAAADSWRRCLS